IGWKTTAPTVFVQEPDQPRGVVMVLPVYGSQQNLATAAEREASLIGWVGAPIRLDRLLEQENIFNPARLLISVSKAGADGEIVLLAGEESASPDGEVHRVLRLGSRDLEVAVSSTDLRVFQPRVSRADLVLFGGVAVTLMLAGLALLLSRTRMRAERLAQHAMGEVGALRAALDEHSILSIADRRGRITDANAGFCAISGYTRDELIGQDHRILNSGHHPKSFWIGMWKTVATGRAWRGEVCNRRKDGTHYWVDSTIVPYLGADGQIEQYVSIRFDITAQKHAEERLELAMRTSRVGLWDLDLDSGTAHFSDSLYRMHGYEPGDFPMNVRSLRQLAHEADLPEVRETLRDHLEGGSPAYVCKHRIRSKDGTFRWVRDSGEIVERHPDGRPSRMIGVHIDVSEEHAAKEEIAMLATRLSVASTGAGLGVWDLDLETDELIWDGTMHQIYGTSPESDIPTFGLWRQSVHEEDLESTEVLLHRALRGEERFDTVFRIITPGGETRHVRGVASLVFDNMGKPVRLVGINADVTPEREMMESLNEAQRLGRLGSWSFDVKTENVSWSDQLFDLYECDKAAGPPDYETCIEMYAPEDRDLIRGAMSEVVETGAPYSLILKRINVGNGVRFIRADGRARFGRSGEVVGVYGTAADVTEQAQGH
ncbi:MAG: PAS domain-containing protein, partial [Pseudomonadota bacterium]